MCVLTVEIEVLIQSVPSAEKAVSPCHLLDYVLSDRKEECVTGMFVYYA
jgi:hypothetical protein